MKWGESFKPVTPGPNNSPGPMVQPWYAISGPFFGPIMPNHRNIYTRYLNVARAWPSGRARAKISGILAPILIKA